MRYNELLKEEGEELNRSQPLDDLTPYLSQIIASVKNPHTTIYRGLNGHEENILYVDPTNYTRRSANTDNYYTLLMDNLPSWSKFPKRSKSLICTTDSDNADTYGQVKGSVYVVLPLGNPIIACCDGEDLWDSFHYVQSEMDISDM